MSSSPAETATPPTKRKRDALREQEDEELEIDVTLPEPPSKKAKRKEKKSKSRPKKESTEEFVKEDVDESQEAVDAVQSKEKSTPASSVADTAKRSEYGIWIGNLPFSVTKDTLRKFLLDEGGIDGQDITRVHMPTGDKGSNKGFAYIDFTTPAVLDIALTLSERLIMGRRCLIKNAKSFEGRPQKSAAETGANGNVSAKPPSQRVFVGNLSFDITREELAEHFSQAGLVEDVFMATFEDSGKSKGFAWVRFGDLEAAKAAVQGFIWKTPENVEEEQAEGGASDEEKPKSKRKNHKPRKWFINRIHGRPLRCEFAEDAQTRYKKRYAGGSSKDRQANEVQSKQDRSAGIVDEEDLAGLAQQAAAARTVAPKKKDSYKGAREQHDRKGRDARTVAPGKALANTQRATGAIVEARGNKVTFE